MGQYLSDEEIDKFFAKDNSSRRKGEFVCENCGATNTNDGPGTYHRNHCAECLFSLHVDEAVGDRKANCKGLMEPIGKFLRPNGEEVIIHKCIKCGKIHNNRVAGDDDIGLVSMLTIIQEDGK